MYNKGTETHITLSTYHIFLVSLTEIHHYKNPTIILGARNLLAHILFFFFFFSLSLSLFYFVESEIEDTIEISIIDRIRKYDLNDLSSYYNNGGKNFNSKLRNIIKTFFFFFWWIKISFYFLLSLITELYLKKMMTYL